MLNQPTCPCCFFHPRKCNNVHVFNHCVALKKPNVDGTQEILRLCCVGKPKFLNYISTMSVLALSGDGNLDEGSPLQAARYVRNARSKWFLYVMNTT